MKLYKLLLFIIVFFLMSFSAHKYYVSLTQIHHNEKTKSVEITLQVFTEDLELSLNNQFKESFLIGTTNEIPQTNQFIVDYLNQKLQLKINGKSVQYKMIGKNIEDDLTYIFLEIINIKALKSINITNKLFFETFEEQQHIFKIKNKGIHKNIILYKDSDNAFINL